MLTMPGSCGPLLDDCWLVRFSPFQFRRQQFLNGLHTPVRGPGLLLEYLQGPLAHGGGSDGVKEQVNQNRSKLFFGSDAERLMGAQILGDGAKIGVVGANDDGDAKLGGLQRIMPPARSEAAAHKCNGGQRVDGGQF